MNNKILLFVMFALFLASCKQEQGNENNLNNEEVSNQFTVYSNEFELFTEADPFIVNRSSNILSHFSNIPKYSALEKGTVTARLIINGEEINQTLNKPTRKGIYSFDIKPEQAGEGNLIFDITTDDGAFQVIVPEVKVFEDEIAAIKDAQKVGISQTNTVGFTKEQSWKIEFATALPHEKPFGQIIKTTAQVQSSQGDETIVSAKTNGVVILSNNNVLEGEIVTRDQGLFSISGIGLAENNSNIRFLEAQNNYDKARSDYQRAMELVKDKIISEEDFLAIKNRYDNTKLIYDNLSQNFNPSGQNINSPINGFVKRLFVKNGQYVDIGQPIVSIAKNNTLLLRAEIQQKFVSILGAIKSANIRTLYDNNNYTLEELNGKILSFGKNTNVDNYLIPVTIQIDNNGKFVPGGFVEVYLKTITNEKALIVPNTAILEEMGNYFIFVQITPELFEKRMIIPEQSDGISTEIVSGLDWDERIITKGAIFVKLAMATGTLDAQSGHNH